MMEGRESPAGETQSGSDWTAKRRVTLVGAVINLALALGKIAAGVLGHSQALIVDGVHSLSDLVSDAVVLGAARWGSIEPDENHPYGHERIETVATAVVGLLLLGVAVVFVVDAILRLLSPERLLNPGWLALSAALLSVLAKEVLYHYTRVIARQTRSMLIAANAWHHRSDALSSLIVIAGVGGVMLGVTSLDAVAAIVVALMVGWMGGRFALSALIELVDTAAPPREQAELEIRIRQVDGVCDLADLRTRRMGGRIVMDVRILLDPDLSLAQADRIAARVRRTLLDESTEVSDVVVSVAPFRQDRTGS